MPDKELREKALALYTPPFRYDPLGDYIWDAVSNMVADNVNEAAVLRIRGWGNIQYHENADKLADTVGELFAEALTEFWVKNQK